MDDEQCCKLGRVAASYGVTPEAAEFDTLDEALVARWRGSGNYRERGYRTLTDWFNRRLLKQVYDQHGRETAGSRLDSEFDALVDGDELTRLEVADDLAASGIDPDEVLADMISWSTMRTHITHCLGAEKQRAAATTDWERDSIAIARDHAETKIGEAVASLGSKGTVAGAADAAVSVDVTLECDECSTSVPLVVAMDRGYVCAAHHRQEAPA
jgi:hypothetical protein